MKRIRRSVFETNSSSMHSISIINRDSREIIESTNGVIDVTLDDYGWGYDILETPEEKLSYILTAFKASTSMSDMVLEAIKEHTGCDINISGDGYIDHNSYNVAYDELKTKEDIISLVFCRSNTIIIDNDNH